MDDFSILGDSCELFFKNPEQVLAKCEETSLAPSWGKCHFMVPERIVLVHKISKRRIDVDKPKVETIKKLPLPTSMKEIIEEIVFRIQCT